MSMEHFKRVFRCKNANKTQPTLENTADVRSRAPTPLLLTDNDAGKSPTGNEFV